MNSFFGLVCFEYKKIFKRKASAAAIIFIILLALASPAFALLGNIRNDDGTAAESNYDARIKDTAYQRALSGRVFDETLLKEMRDAYAKIPPVPADKRPSGTPEYQRYARAYNAVYQIASFVYGTDGIESVKYLKDEQFQDFAKARHEAVAAQIESENMSEKSKMKMTSLDSEVKMPLVFSYSGGYEAFYVNMFSLGLFAAFALSACLAPIFAGEYQTRASQLILASKYGKNKVIAAKIFTVISLCVILGALTALANFLTCAVLYGTDGANAPIQMFMPLIPYNLTMSQGAFIIAACITFALVTVGVISALLSSKSKSPFPVMIVMSVFLFAPPMFNVPSVNILIYNLYSMLPSCTLYAWTLFSHIPYEFFGLSAIPYRFIPVCYTVLSAVMIPFAYRAFKGHQAA